jgi:hypothetical protein
VSRPDEGGTAREVATEALVRNVIGIGVSVAFVVGISWAIGQRYRAEHLWWRLRQQMTARQRAEDGAVAELRRDISRWEHRERAEP